MYAALEYIPKFLRRVCLFVQVRYECPHNSQVQMIFGSLSFWELFIRHHAWMLLLFRVFRFPVNPSIDLLAAQPRFVGLVWRRVWVGYNVPNTSNRAFSLPLWRIFPRKLGKISADGAIGTVGLVGNSGNLGHGHDSSPVNGFFNPFRGIKIFGRFL